jgi:parvulin-like peptidyl-prolyl isomerase
MLTVLVALAACSSPFGPPADVAAIVDGAKVPKALYDDLVDAGTVALQRTGLKLDASTPSGAQKVKQLQSEAIRILVNDYVIQEVADRDHVKVTSAEVDDAIAKLETTVGGRDALDQRLEQQGLSRPTYRRLFRYNVMSIKLQELDPTGYQKKIERASKAAKVEAYVGPCQDDHEYPRCLGS